MNVVVVTICYPPEIRSISLMVREFCEYLAARGHAVTVLTGWPQYNLSDDDRARTFAPVSDEGGVRVIRIKTLPTHKVAYVVRGVAQLLLPFLFWRAYRRHVRERPDAVVVYSPHLPLTVVGRRIKRTTGARFLLNIQDIFPQGAMDLGVLRNRWAIRFFERMERRAYEAADAITTCTQRARDFLIECKGVVASRVHTVPNWIDTVSYDRAVSRQHLRREHGIADDACLIVFPGILGPTQGLDFVLDIAARLHDDPAVQIVFVGEGTEEARLRERMRAEGLANVHLWSFVSPDRYPELLKEADIGLMTLRHDCKTPTVPGKLFGFLAAGLPVAAFLNPESEGHDMIRAAGCGLAMESRDAGAAARALRAFVADAALREACGRRGHAYVKANFSKEAIIQQLASLL